MPIFFIQVSTEKKIRDLNIRKLGVQGRITFCKRWPCSTYI